MGYGDYLERADLSDGKLFILRALAKQEDTPANFVNRLDVLQKTIREKESDLECPFILSTIHASKGLEYDTVYLIDMIDGIFPESVPENMKNAEKEELEAFEEERRIFYVGVTRAKEQLCIFQTSMGSTFVKQLLNTPKKESKKEPKKELNYERFLENLGEGLLVEHKLFGKGVITNLTGSQVTIQFEDSVKNLGLKICFEKKLLKIE
jgi:DNA helicase-2/ATP-dependent DNA helicase PcrA